MEKITITLLLLILFSSCKTNEKILQDYINHEINNCEETTFFVVKEKIIPKRVITTLLGEIRVKNNEQYTYSGSKEFTVKEFQEMYKKYENDTILKTWNSKNFDFKNLELISILDENEFYEKFIKLALNSKLAYIYYLSEPIYLKNKEFLVFYVSKSSTDRINNPFYNKVLLYKKINKKYVFVEEINEAILY